MPHAFKVFVLCGEEISWTFDRDPGNVIVVIVELATNIWPSTSYMSFWPLHLSRSSWLPRWSRNVRALSHYNFAVSAGARDSSVWTLVYIMLDGYPWMQWLKVTCHLCSRTSRLSFQPGRFSCLSTSWAKLGRGFHLPTVWLLAFATEVMEVLTSINWRIQNVCQTYFAL